MPTDPQRRARPRWAGLPAVLSLAILVALAIRMTVRDRWPLLSTVYYATPWVVIALACLISSAMWWRCGRRWLAGWLLAAFLGCSAAWFSTAWHHRATAATERQWRAMYWNTQRCPLDRAGFSSYLQQWNADLIALAEIDGDLGQWQRFAARQFPQYQSSRPFRGMAMLVKGQILAQRNEKLPDNGRLTCLRLRLDDTELDVVIVDLNSNPLASRAEVIQAIADHIERLGDRPLLLLGDFNTPLDSVHFQVLRQRLQHASEQAGQGYAATWPVPVPVLQIDHIWASAELIFARFQCGWSTLSDHRAVIADMDLSQARQGGQIR